MKPSWLPAHLDWLWPLSREAVLRALVLGEAEGEQPAGMKAVADVVVNRVLLAREHKVTWWGRTVHEVCLYRHQFSPFWSDYDLRRSALRRGAFLDPAEGPVMEAHRAAVEALRRLDGDPTAEGDRSFGADHFFAPKGVPQPPAWARQYPLTCRVGGHQFHTSLFA